MNISWRIRVNSLVCATVLIFTFYVWNILTYIFAEQIASNSTLIFGMLSIIATQYLINREKNTKIMWLLFLIVVGTGNYLLTLSIGNLIFQLLVIYITMNLDKRDVEYREFKQKSIVAVYIFIAIQVLVAIFSSTLNNTTFKIAVVFVIVDIITLRQLRNYFFQLKEKRAFQRDIAIIAILIALTNDRLSKLVGNVCNIIGRVFSFFMEYVAIAVAFIGGKILMFLEHLLGENSEQKIEDFFDNLNKTSTEEEPTNKIVDKNTIDYNLIIKIVAVIVVIIILYKIYKSISSKRMSKIELDNDVIDEREKIDVKKKSKRRVFSDIFNRIRLREDNKGQVYYIYKKFEQKTNKMGIFERFMTATQLGNIVSAEINEKDNVKSMTEIYNEAKFSDNEISEVEIKEIKKNYDVVKEKIKEGSRKKRDR